jgi:hypothetical protein
MLLPRRRSLVLAAALALAACDHDAPDPPPEAPPPPPRPAARSAGSVASAAPAAPPPPLSASAPDPGAPDALAGTWEAAYDAKKGSLDLPPKVKDPGRDDGKTAVGPGKLELTIAANGDVHGKGTGALGASTLTGRAEGGTLRATLLPDDPRAQNAMTGVLIGLIKGDVIRGEIHVAGPDGTMVREAQVELKKKP